MHYNFDVIRYNSIIVNLFNSKYTRCQLSYFRCIMDHTLNKNGVKFFLYMYIHVLFTTQTFDLILAENSALNPRLEG